MTNTEELAKILGRDLSKQMEQESGQELPASAAPTFRTPRWGRSRGVGDFGRINYTIPQVGLPPESPRANLYGKSLNPNRSPVGGGVPMGNVLRWEASPENRRLFAERTAAWEERAAEVGTRQIVAREQAIEAYRKASPQERMFIAPELRAQIESEILQRSAASLQPANAPAPASPRTRVPTTGMQMAEAKTDLNQASLDLRRTQPSQPPLVERPSPIRGGGFYVPPEYIRLQREQARKVQSWTGASDLVERQRRKLLTRAINQPDEEE